jgi:hypothetical protein
MRVHLRACARCTRHIRITEATCVFCGAPVDDSRRSAPPIGNASTRLRRAATVVAIGAAAGAGGTLEACFSNSGDGGGEPVMGSPMYGLAYLPDSGPDVVTGGDGAAPMHDATADTEAPDASDTGAADVLTGGDAYGAPDTGAPDAPSDAIEDGGAAD